MIGSITLCKVTALDLLLCAVYQIVLLSGLNVYLMSPQRGPGLLSLNKEGIASTFGGRLSQLFIESIISFKGSYLSSIIMLNSVCWNCGRLLGSLFDQCISRSFSQFETNKRCAAYSIVTEQRRDKNSDIAPGVRCSNMDS